MTDRDDRQHRLILQRIAHRAMLEQGLVPGFPVQALAELMGAGESVVERPGVGLAGHFGLAVKDLPTRQRRAADTRI